MHPRPRRIPPQTLPQNPLLRRILPCPPRKHQTDGQRIHVWVVLPLRQFLLFLPPRSPPHPLLHPPVRFLLPHIRPMHPHPLCRMHPRPRRIPPRTLLPQNPLLRRILPRPPRKHQTDGQRIRVWAFLLQLLPRPQIRLQLPRPHHRLRLHRMYPQRLCSVSAVLCHPVLRLPLQPQTSVPLPAPSHGWHCPIRFQMVWFLPVPPARQTIPPQAVPGMPSNLPQAGTAVPSNPVLPPVPKTVRSAGDPQAFPPVRFHPAGQTAVQKHCPVLQRDWFPLPVPFPLPWHPAHPPVPGSALPQGIRRKDLLFPAMPASYPR